MLEMFGGVKVEVVEMVDVCCYGNYGVVCVEWLCGNIGYLDLCEFVLVWEVGLVLVVVMMLLVYIDVFIIDLCCNGGGEFEIV